MSVNKAIILGRLGGDPELRYTNTGKAVCRFSVATSEKYVNNAGEQVQNTEWHRIVAWGKQAENANNYLKKGSEVYLEGRIKTTSYDKEGQKHWATDIHADFIQYIGGRAQSNSGENQQEQPPQQNQNKPKAQNNQNKPKAQNDQGPEPDFSDFGGKPGDDDIPF